MPSACDDGAVTELFPDRFNNANPVFYFAQDHRRSRTGAESEFCRIEGAKLASIHLRRFTPP